MVCLDQIEVTEMRNATILTRGAPSEQSVNQPLRVPKSNRNIQEMILFKVSSNGDVNWDIMPVVDRKKVNKGKRDKAHNITLRSPRFDQFLFFLFSIGHGMGLIKSQNDERCFPKNLGHFPLLYLGH